MVINCVKRYAGLYCNDVEVEIKSFDDNKTKTKTLVARASYMIEKGVKPEEMVLFTFTNKAANEIKERIIKAIGDEGQKITMGTYHSICVRLLRKYCDRLGYERNFTILDEEDTNKILREIFKQYKSVELRDVKAYIRDCKKKMLTPSSAITSCEVGEKVYAEIYQKYQDIVNKNNSMDFDDLILNTVRVFETNPDVVEAINKKWKYLTADEWHDSSKCDIRLIDYLAGDNKNLCVILDDEQSIYSFRGADVKSVLKYKEELQPKTFILRENYRSTKNIVKASRSLITHNKHQIPKELFTNNDEGTPVVYFEESKPSDEALRVLKLVIMLNRQYNIAYKDMAILYRMTYLSREIEQTLLKAGIPYTLKGGTSFYSRKEIKDIMSYLKLIYNNKDRLSFIRAVNVPKRGIGDKTIEKIIEYSKENDVDLLSASAAIKLTGKAKQGIAEFNRIISEINSFINDSKFSETNLKLLIDKIITETNYVEYLKETESSSVAEDKAANLVELINISGTFLSIEEFIENMSLNESLVDNNSEDDKVNLQTMHGSKGLEYKAVIIIGANEGTIPHREAIAKYNVTEERRLFYVAMTRAKEYLFITRSKTSVYKGQYTNEMPSRFIKEIDKKYLREWKDKSKR